MATAQSQIYSLLRIYHFATAHLPIIYVVQIDQLFHRWKSSKYSITVHRRIVWLQIAYLETIQTFMSLLRKAQFFGYCAPYNYFPTTDPPIIHLLQIDKIFHKSKSSKYLLTVHRKIVWQLQITYFEIYRRFIWLLHKAQCFGYCASINLLLRISQLFMYCKSTNYLQTGIRLHNCLPCKENCMTTSNRLFGNISTIHMATAQSTIFGNCASII